MYSETLPSLVVAYLTQILFHSFLTIMLTKFDIWSTKVKHKRLKFKLYIFIKFFTVFQCCDHKKFLLEVHRFILFLCYHLSKKIDIENFSPTVPINIVVYLLFYILAPYRVYSSFLLFKINKFPLQLILENRKSLAKIKYIYMLNIW